MCTSELKRPPFDPGWGSMSCFLPSFKSFVFTCSLLKFEPKCSFPDVDLAPLSTHRPCMSACKCSPGTPAWPFSSRTLLISGLEDTESGESTWARTEPPIECKFVIETSLVCGLASSPIGSGWREFWVPDNPWRCETAWRGILIGARRPMLLLRLLLAPLASLLIVDELTFKSSSWIPKLQQSLNNQDAKERTWEDLRNYNWNYSTKHPDLKRTREIINVIMNQPITIFCNMAKKNIKSNPQPKLHNNCSVPYKLHMIREVITCFAVYWLETYRAWLRIVHHDKGLLLPCRGILIVLFFNCPFHNCWHNLWNVAAHR
jgi:hypothetical protein